MTPSSNAEAFRPFLISGERILWTGQPVQGLLLTSRDVLLIPMSLLWGGFALFWNAGVWAFGSDNEGAPLFFKLFGLPFLIAGLYFMLGRFFMDAFVRKHSHYAVSDHRVLILRTGFGRKVRSLDLNRLPMLELTEHADGTGTIAFDVDDDDSWLTRGRGLQLGFWSPALRAAPQFLRIASPRQTYELIRRTAYH